MANQSANPFLMDEEYISPSAAKPSNPFLMGDDYDDGDNSNENPFISSGQDTNPFACGFEEPDVGSTVPNFFTTMDTMPTTMADIIYASAGQAIDTMTTDILLFDDGSADMQNSQAYQPQKPMELNLKDKNRIANADEALNAYSSEEELSKAGIKRAPPARPTPPSKETQDLILSVTGHMEQTSSHLLDRLPATRTPSPVSMRDLHSPSPTPENTFAEFLNIDPKPMVPQPQQPLEMNFFDLDSDNDKSLVEPIPTQSIPVKGENPFAVDVMESCEMAQNQVADEPLVNHTAAAFMQEEPQIQHVPAMVPSVPPMVPSVPPMVSSVPPMVPSVPPMVSTAPPKVSRMPMISNMHAAVKLAQQTAPAANVPPARPAPPGRPTPPRPQPPARPQSPNVQPVPQRPPVPPPPARAVTPVQASDDADLLDMFGEKPPVPQPPKSKADILNLFSSTTTNTAPPTTDLLSDDSFLVSTEPPAVPSAPAVQPAAVIPQAPVVPEAPVKPPPPAVPPAPPARTNRSTDPSPAITPTTNPFDIPSAEPIINESIQQEEVLDFSMPAQPQEVIQPAQLTPVVASPPKIPPTNAFDEFAAKFESAEDHGAACADPFGGASGGGAWGAVGMDVDDSAGASGFDADDGGFDAFLSMSEPPPVPQGTPARPFGRSESLDSDEGKDFSIFIKPKNGSDLPSSESITPALAPPPTPLTSAMADTSPRFNPFDKSEAYSEPQVPMSMDLDTAQIPRTDSQETPPTPLFDEDVSQPLEEFPRVTYAGEGWEMQLRQPNKKKITGQRFWKKVFIKLVYQGDSPVLLLFNTAGDKDPFQELPLQACYSVSDIGAQQYDTFGKIFTVKLQYVFYKERPGVRPGQVTKAERITNKLSQFAAYAIQGDYAGVKEFGSDLKKLGLPVEHAPQISQLFKIGSQEYEDMKQFSMCIEEALFKMAAHRDRALNYKMEEVQITAVDELYVEQDAEGRVLKQIARVRLFFLGFLSGMPDVELGVNDMRRQGKEVVGRHDIIPVVTEEWIRLENVEFHACVQQEEFERTKIIKFKPPDACYIELIRFRIRPPKNRELPLQLKPTMCVTGNKVELRADVLVPGFASRKLGQVPCEDVMIRFPIPECWIYLFRVEKHFRYGSVKSAHRRTGKIKGIERFLGAVDTLQESLIEVTSGQAKYEHQHRSIVWRMPRLPKEGQGAYTTHQLVCRMALTSYDQIPENLADWCYVEFTMPATQASHTTVRSVSLQGSDSDEPPEKYVRYLARHEYKVGIEHTQGEGPAAYTAATLTQRAAPVKEEPAEVPTPAAPSDTDSDSD